MDKLCETINRQCCLHCEMECDGKWLETEIEIYKEDLLKKQADKITDLETKLAEKEPYLYDEGGDPLSKKDVADLLNRQNNEIKKLENELVEKDELLMKKICDMKSTDFIKMLKRYGFIVQAKEIDNQTAIAELEKVKVKLNEEINNANVLLDPVEYEDYHELLGVIRGYKLSVDQIDQQITELKGETNE